MHLTSFIAAAASVALISAQGNGMTNLTALLSSTDSLSQLSALLGAYPSIATSLASASNVTLFAPNNEAIMALKGSGALSGITEDQVAAILSYHVVNGTVYSSAIAETPTFAHTMLTNTTYANVTGGQVIEAQLVNDSVIITSGLKSKARVVTANQNYTGGVVHIIDSALTIPLPVSSTASAANLTALVGAFSSAGLVDTLDGLSDVTIFAPSNAAFEAIGSAAANLNMSQLTSILEYHVINGTVGYSSLLTNESVPALAGGNLTITVEDGAVFVNAARIINADILIAGGVVHVIDSVLNPANASAAPDASSNQPAAQFSGASSASLPALTSGVPPASTTVSALTATTADVAQGYATPAASGSGGSGSSTSSGIGYMPTAAIGAAALFGGFAVVAQW